MSQQYERRIEMRPVSSLKPYANNPRTHSKKQIRQIADSIREFGWTNPVLTDAAGNVLAGHGRIEAAKFLGETEIPVLRLEHMNEAQKRAIIIADNKLAENAGWNDDLLATELQFLTDIELDFDVELTGFDMGEIDVLLSPATAAEAEPVELPDPDAAVVSRTGDLWLIGPHRILCGNSLEQPDWQALMGSNMAQMVFTDPPYNVKISGNVSGRGRAKHREFAMASGEMCKEGFTAFLRSAFRLLAENSKEGAIHYVCMDWRHMTEILSAAEGIYTELKNLCVWAKTNAGMGTFYRSQHELVFAFKSGKAPHINNFGLGESGRHRSNLWTYAGANTFRAGRLEDLEAHPTVKPVDMISDAIMDCSKRGDLVVDAFAGSGTTLIAAARTGRIGAGIEIDPVYVDLIIRRLEKETGTKAIHAGLFDSFEAVSASRLAEVE
jgi:DNA modification methylase